MVASVFVTLYAGITKDYGILLYISLALIFIECIVYFGNGMVCPFTDLAKKYGDPKGYVGDIFMPKKVADNTFYIFGALFIIAIIILIMNFFELR
jgi:hypothetical protein